MRGRAAILLALVAAAPLAGVPVRAADGPAPAPSPILVDRIAAVVNDQVITLSEVDSQIPPPVPTAPDEREKARRETLDRLIEAALISQEAARANVTVSEQEVDAEIAAVREREKLSQEELERALAAEGLTFEEYRERLKDNIRRAKAVSRLVRGSLSIPDSRLRAYYEANAARFTPPASVRLRLLLVPVSPGASDAERAIARAEAQALRLRALNGEPFEDLVKAHSRGPAAEEGGDLGVMPAAALDPRFEEAIKGLEPGQVSEPVVLDGGVALLQLVTREGGEPRPFEEVRDEIYRKLYDEEFEKAVSQWVKDLRAKAHVEVKL
ncbi:MAG TPA: peptidyl-prolyl cis-trans isomerase [Thermodesulfobacteriota bacterium]